MLEAGSHSVGASKEGKKVASWLRCIKARARWKWNACWEGSIAIKVGIRSTGAKFETNGCGREGNRKGEVAKQKV